MDVEITRKNGESFRLSEYDIQAQDFNVSSIELMPTYGSIEGRSGAVDYGADYGSRTISVPFYLRARDMHDYPILRDELFSLVTTKESFYIRELRRPTEFTTCDDGYDDGYVGGKRYLVRLSNVIDLDQQRTYGFGEMVFETSELPFAESIGTSADIDKNGIPKDWIGMGFDGVSGLSYRTLVYGEGSTTEQFILPFFSVRNSNALGYFRIFNPGIAVHPFEQEIKISVYDADGSDEYLELVNNTNGSSFRLNEGLENKKLVIDGPNITLNNLQALRKTNRKYVELSPGWNEFSLKGVIKATIEFDFRFYYL